MREKVGRRKEGESDRQGETGDRKRGAYIKRIEGQTGLTEEKAGCVTTPFLFSDRAEKTMAENNTNLFMEIFQSFDVGEFL